MQKAARLLLFSLCAGLLAWDLLVYATLGPRWLPWSATELIRGLTEDHPCLRLALVLAGWLLIGLGYWRDLGWRGLLLVPLVAGGMVHLFVDE